MTPGSMLQIAWVVRDARFHPIRIFGHTGWNEVVNVMDNCSVSSGLLSLEGREWDW